MKVVNLKLSQVKPYANNPRKNDQAVEGVAASIREFGFCQPLVVDRDYVIIVGDTRFKAAKRLNLKTIPVYVADHLTAAQIAAYRLADNKVGEKSVWADDLLADEIAALKDSDIDLSEMGFELEQKATELRPVEERLLPALT